MTGPERGMGSRSARVTNIRSRAFLLICCLLQSVAVWSQTVPEYNLQPGDQIEVSVWGEEDLQRTVLIRPDGRLSFPLVGEVIALGRTAPEVEAEMTEKIRPYVPEAVVTVAVSSIEGNRIYVIGQVNDPGTFVMNPRLSVLQALSLAGGLTAFASIDDIRIIRRSGDAQRAIPFRYSDISRGRDLEQNIQLEGGDVVLVP